MMEIQGFERYLKKRGRSKSTIISYTSVIRNYLKQYRLNFDDACRWKEESMQRLKPASVNLGIHALNSFAEYNKAKFRLKPVKIQMQQYVENQMTMSQYQKLCSCLLEDDNLRWWAAIRVLAGTGVRISEFLQIKTEDLKRGYVDVCGKGTKYRRIWFPAQLRQEILSKYREPGYILPYSDGVIRKRLHSFAKKYRIPKEVLHPHEFRAFYARNVYEKCKDIKFLQDLLGHASVQTTMRYLRKTSKGIGRRISKIVTW